MMKGKYDSEGRVECVNDAEEKQTTMQVSKDVMNSEKRMNEHTNSF